MRRLREQPADRHGVGLHQLRRLRDRWRHEPRRVLPAVTERSTRTGRQATGPKVGRRRSSRSTRPRATATPTAACSSTPSPTARRTNTIAYDRATMQQAHDSVGDFAAGVLLAAEWSSAVQQRLGHPLGSAAARKIATCLTGAYTASLDGTLGVAPAATASRCRPATSTRWSSMLVAADSPTTTAARRSPGSRRSGPATSEGRAPASRSSCSSHNQLASADLALRVC